MTTAVASRFVSFALILSLAIVVAAVNALPFHKAVSLPIVAPFAELEASGGSRVFGALPGGGFGVVDMTTFALVWSKPDAGLGRIHNISLWEAPGTTTGGVALITLGGAFHVVALVDGQTIGKRPLQGITTYPSAGVLRALPTFAPCANPGPAADRPSHYTAVVFGPSDSSFLLVGSIDGDENTGVTLVALTQGAVVEQLVGTSSHCAVLTTSNGNAVSSLAPGASELAPLPALSGGEAVQTGSLPPSHQLVAALLPTDKPVKLVAFAAGASDGTVLSADFCSGLYGVEPTASFRLATTELASGGFLLALAAGQVVCGVEGDASDAATPARTTVASWIAYVTAKWAAASPSGLVAVAGTDTVLSFRGSTGEESYAFFATPSSRPGTMCVLSDFAHKDFGVAVMADDGSVAFAGADGHVVKAPAPPGDGEFHLLCQSTRSPGTVAVVSASQRPAAISGFQPSAPSRRATATLVTDAAIFDFNGTHFSARHAATGGLLWAAPSAFAAAPLVTGFKALTSFRRWILTASVDRGLVAVDKYSGKQRAIDLRRVATPDCARDLSAATLTGSPTVLVSPDEAVALFPGGCRCVFRIGADLVATAQAVEAPVVSATFMAAPFVLARTNTSLFVLGSSAADVTQYTVRLPGFFVSAVTPHTVTLTAADATFRGLYLNVTAGTLVEAWSSTFATAIAGGAVTINSAVGAPDSMLTWGDATLAPLDDGAMALLETRATAEGAGIIHLTWTAPIPGCATPSTMRDRCSVDADAGNLVCANATHVCSAVLSSGASSFEVPGPATSALCTAGTRPVFTRTPTLSLLFVTSGTCVRALRCTNGAKVFDASLRVPAAMAAATPGALVGVSVAGDGLLVTEAVAFPRRELQAFMDPPPRVVAPATTIAGHLVSPPRPTLAPASIAGVIEPAPQPLQTWATEGSSSSSYTTPQRAMTGGVLPVLTTQNQGIHFIAADGRVVAKVDFNFDRVSGIVVAGDLAIAWGATVFAAYNASGAQVWSRAPITVTAAHAAGNDRVAYVRNNEQQTFSAAICDAATGTEQGFGTVEGTKPTLVQGVESTTGEWAAVAGGFASLVWVKHNTLPVTVMGLRPRAVWGGSAEANGVTVVAAEDAEANAHLAAFSFAGSKLFDLTLQNPLPPLACVVTADAAVCLMTKSTISAYSVTSNTVGTVLWTVAVPTSAAVQTLVPTRFTNGSLVPVATAGGLGRCAVAFVQNYGADTSDAVACYDTSAAGQGRVLWAAPTSMAYNSFVSTTTMAATVSDDLSSLVVAFNSQIAAFGIGRNATTGGSTATPAWMFAADSGSIHFTGAALVTTPAGPAAVALGESLEEVRAFIVNTSLKSYGVSATPDTRLPAVHADAKSGTIAVVRGNVLECRAAKNGAVISLTALGDAPAKDPDTPGASTTLPKLVDLDAAIVVRRLGTLQFVAKLQGASTHGFEPKRGNEMSFATLLQSCPYGTSADTDTPPNFLKRARSDVVVIAIGSCIFALGADATLLSVDALEPSLGLPADIVCDGQGAAADAACVVLTGAGLAYDLNVSNSGSAWQRPLLPADAHARTALRAKAAYTVSPALGIVSAYTRLPRSVTAWTVNVSAFGTAGVQAPLVFNGSLFVATDTALVAIDARLGDSVNGTGNVLWTHVSKGTAPQPPAPLRATPVATAWGAIVSSHTSRIEATNAVTGTLVWSVDVPAPCSDLQLAPNDARLIIGVCGSAVVVDAARGSVLYQLATATAATFAVAAGAPPIAVVSAASGGDVFAWELPLSLPAAPPTDVPATSLAPAPPMGARTASFPVTASPKPMANAGVTPATASEVLGLPMGATSVQLDAGGVVSCSPGNGVGSEMGPALVRSSVEGAASANWRTPLVICGCDAATAVVAFDGFVAAVCAAGLEHVAYATGVPMGHAAVPANMNFSVTEAPSVTRGGTCAIATYTAGGGDNAGAVVCLPALYRRVVKVFNITAAAGTGRRPTKIVASTLRSVAVAFTGSVGPGFMVIDIFSSGPGPSTPLVSSTFRAVHLHAVCFSVHAVIEAVNNDGAFVATIVDGVTGSTVASDIALSPDVGSITDAFVIPQGDSTYLLTTAPQYVVAYTGSGAPLDFTMTAEKFFSITGTPTLTVAVDPANFDAATVKHVVVSHNGANEQFVKLFSQDLSKVLQVAANPTALMPVPSVDVTAAFPMGSDGAGGWLLYSAQTASFANAALGIQWQAASSTLPAVSGQNASTALVASTFGAVYVFTMRPSGYVQSTTTDARRPVVAGTPALLATPEDDIIVNTGNAVRLIRPGNGSQSRGLGLPGAVSRLVSAAGPGQLIVTTEHGVALVSVQQEALAVAADFPPLDFAEGPAVSHGSFSSLDFFGGSRGGIYTVNTASGTTLPFTGLRSTSVAVRAIEVAVPTVLWLGSDARLRGFSAAGPDTPQWEVPVLTGASKRVFQTYGSFVYAVEGASSVVCIDTASGRVAARAAITSSVALVAAVVVYDGTVFVTDGAALYATAADPATMGSTITSAIAPVNGSTGSGAVALVLDDSAQRLVLVTSAGMVFVAPAVGASGAAPSLSFVARTGLEPVAPLAISLGVIAVAGSGRVAVVDLSQLQTVTFIPVPTRAVFTVDLLTTGVGQAVVSVSYEHAVTVAGFNVSVSPLPPAPSPTSPLPPGGYTGTAKPLPTAATLPPGQQWPSAGCYGNQIEAMAVFGECIADATTRHIDWVESDMPCTDLAVALSACSVGFVDRMGSACAAGNAYLQRELGALNATGALAGLCNGICSAATNTMMCRSFVLPTSASPAPTNLATNAPTLAPLNPLPRPTPFTGVPTTGTANPVTTSTSAPTTTGVAPASTTTTTATPPPATSTVAPTGTQPAPTNVTTTTAAPTSTVAPTTTAPATTGAAAEAFTLTYGKASDVPSKSRLEAQLTLQAAALGLGTPVVVELLGIDQAGAVTATETYERSFAFFGALAVANTQALFAQVRMQPGQVAAGLGALSIVAVPMPTPAPPSAPAKKHSSTVAICVGCAGATIVGLVAAFALYRWRVKKSGMTDLDQHTLVNAQQEDAPSEVSSRASEQLATREPSVVGGSVNYGATV